MPQPVFTRPNAKTTPLVIALPALQQAHWRAAIVAALLALLLLAPAMQASAASDVFPKVLPLPNGFAPEGIATGRGTDFFVGSLAGGAIYMGDLRTGEGDVLVEPVENRAITGIKIDERTNYVWAAGAGSGDAYVFDANTGEELAVYDLTDASPTFINDLVITVDAVYFTDSQQPVLYRVPLGPGGALLEDADVDVIPLGGDFQMVPGFNVNGIDATPNGKTLVIVQSATGFIFTVDPETGIATRVDLQGGSVPRGDGILLDGKTLYVVQNAFNQIAVIDLDISSNSGTIVDLITDPLFRIPTTVAEFGNRLYAVNARFGTPASPATEYEAVQVEK